MSDAEINEFLGSGTIDRVKEMADTFGDNKDRILEAVDWVWDHRDELIDRTQRPPELLGQAGESPAVAGDGAVRASGLLTGEDGDDLAVVGLGLRDGGVELAECAGRDVSKPNGKRKPKAKPKGTSKPRSNSKPKPSSKKPASGGGLDLGTPS